MLRKTRPFALLLAILTLLAAPAISHAQEYGLDDSALEPDPQSDCQDTDEGLLDEILQRDRTFFQSEYFDCDDHFVTAERAFAPLLTELGQEPLGERASRYEGEGPVNMVLRRTYRQELVRRILRIDCRIGREPDEQYRFPPRGLGGTVTLIRHNGYAPENDGTYSLVLGAADCEFLRRRIDSTPLYEIEQIREFDRKGPIIIHAGSTLVEAVDEDGDYELFPAQRQSRLYRR